MAAEEVNFKSKLIEWAQKSHLRVEFRLIEQQQGRQGSPVFVTRIVIEGLDCETGKGYSKKESHQQAAKSTLQSLKSDKMLVQCILAARDQRAENNII